MRWTATKGNFTIKVEQDSYAENPRISGCFSHVCSMVTWHRNADLCENNIPMDDYDGPTDVLNRFIKENNEDVVAYLPLYLYQHSGMTISTTPFSCPWDSGQVGWIWVTEKKLEEYGIEKRYHADELQSYMKEEVETLDQYLQGDVYEAFVDDNEIGESIDYTNDLYGTDWKDNGLYDFIMDNHPDLLELIDNLKEEE